MTWEEHRIEELEQQNKELREKLEIRDKLQCPVCKFDMTPETQQICDVYDESYKIKGENEDLQKEIKELSEQIKELKEELNDALLTTGSQYKKLEKIKELDLHNSPIPQTSESFSRFLKKQAKLKAILDEESK